MSPGRVRADGAPLVGGRPAAPVVDEADARRLLQRALGALQKWPEGFRGFQARVRCGDGAREVVGEVRVFVGGAVESTLPRDPLGTWTEAGLQAVARACTPSFFKDGAGRFPITLDADDGHPRGRRVRVHPADGRLWAYRIDDRSRIRLEERSDGVRRQVTVFDDFTRACPGRWLPTRWRTFTWDGRTDTLLDAVESEDAVGRRDHVWLPLRRRAVSLGQGRCQVRWLELDGHAWL